MRSRGRVKDDLSNVKKWYCDHLPEHVLGGLYGSLEQLNCSVNWTPVAWEYKQRGAKWGVTNYRDMVLICRCSKRLMPLSKSTSPIPIYTRICNYIRIAISLPSFPVLPRVLSNLQFSSVFLQTNFKNHQIENLKPSFFHSIFVSYNFNWGNFIIKRSSFKKWQELILISFEGNNSKRIFKIKSFF